MDENTERGKPCRAGRPSIEPPHSLTGAPDMSTVAALCIVAFLAVMALLNRIEFGRVD